jgi:hypothetical protein
MMLLQAVIARTPSRRSKGYGFVTFGTKEAAARALATPHIRLDGRMLLCKLAALGRINKNKTSTASLLDSTSSTIDDRIWSTAPISHSLSSSAFDYQQSLIASSCSSSQISSFPRSSIAFSAITNATSQNAVNYNTTNLQQMLSAPSSLNSSDAYLATHPTTSSTTSLAPSAFLASPWLRTSSDGHDSMSTWPSGLGASPTATSLLLLNTTTNTNYTRL